MSENIYKRTNDTQESIQNTDNPALSGFRHRTEQNLVVRISWDWLCGHCRKKYLMNALPLVKRYIREHPQASLRSVARFYGIPHSTLHDRLRLESRDASRMTKQDNHWKTQRSDPQVPSRE